MIKKFISRLLGKGATAAAPASPAATSGGQSQRARSSTAPQSSPTTMPAQGKNPMAPLW